MITFPKLLAIITIALFGIIGTVALFKGDKKSKTPSPLSTPIEVELGNEMGVAVVKKTTLPKPALQAATTTKKDKTSAAKIAAQEPPSSSPPQTPITAEKTVALPNADRVDQLFNKKGPTLPIVETITYKSHVSWQKGRPAWLSDYASHYHTSRHFIARSLNGSPDYFKQDLAEGDRFNVLRLDKNIQFYALIDISRCRLWLYYDDLSTHERVLLKTYQIGLGRVDTAKASGCLTPIGKYTLGNKIAIYKPKAMGKYHGQTVEMITVFGTRWIPFDKEVEACSSPAKGFGIHGVPWIAKGSAEPVEDRSSLGKHQSDGCIRMASEDVEEFFAITITKPTTVELVKDFFDARTPSNITIIK